MQEQVAVPHPLITNDAVVLGLLMAILGLVFATSNSQNPRLQKFYKVVPPLLMCYFLPSIFSSLGIIDGETSKLYQIAANYLLPACLVLLCLSVDLKGLVSLGPKALIMFFTGTLGVMLGGPIALLITKAIAPDVLAGTGENEAWRGMATLAGSWIGGGANQAAMKEIFNVGGDIFSSMLAVDIIVANLWMAILLLLASKSDQIDAYIGADNSAIQALKTKMSHYQNSIARMPTQKDLMLICGIAFGLTGLAHLGADFLGPFFEHQAPALLASLSGMELSKAEHLFSWLSLSSKFFWIVVLATIFGVFMSTTKARELEGAGASKIGTLLLYVMIASIGMKMNLMAIFSRPGLFMVGAIWMLVHGILLLVVAKLIRAPLFFVAVGSQANIGAAASAPVVASAFHPTLAPVGVLLAVLGYAVGTIAAWLCGLTMQVLSGG